MSQLLEAVNQTFVDVDHRPVATALEYSNRRDKLFASLPDNSAVIVVSAAEVLRNGTDNTFDYRQRSDLLYLSGFPEANAVLVLKKCKSARNARGREKFVMFVAPQDRASELWHGKRVGLEGAVNNFGAASAYPIAKLAGQLRKLLASGVERVYFTRGGDSKLEAKMDAVLKQLGLKTIDTVDNLISELRLIKSEAELRLMSRAAQFGVAAHLQAMRFCKPGRAESELKAKIEYVFTLLGNSPPSYGTIVAGGVNSLSLHHPAGLDRLRDGDLVLIDAGCEVEGYASDITRTFPVNGRFTEAQKEIYELVLAAQLTAIAAIKPGASFDHLEAACNKVLKQGLIALGFPLGKSSRNKIALSEMFPHGLGHWLGLDVHDVGRYKRLDKPKRARPLVPGMVLTIEPGLYLGANDTRIPERYRGIAVRIEDDIEVRHNGSHVLTHGIKKTVASIEWLMKNR